MQTHSIKTILTDQVPADSAVEIKGWIRTTRDSKGGFSFLIVHDGSCFDGIQVVADQSLENYQSEILKLFTGCSVIVRGTLTESGGKGQKFEIKADQVEVVGWVENPDSYPVQPKRHSMEYLRDVAHLRIRTNTFSAMMRVRNTMAQAVHQYFSQNGYFWLHTPIITASDCEGAGDLFRVSTLDLMNLPKNQDGSVNFNEDFFGKETYLTVSGQLNAETYACALSKVYTFGPTFRAENSHTQRHLAEFWMVEPEVAFADLNDVAQLAEDFLKFLVKQVLANNPDDMNFFNQFVDKGCIQRLETLLDDSFAHVDYAEALEILKKVDVKFDYPVEWGLDLKTEHERYLTEQHFKKPIVVKNYPEEIKPFYMRLNDDGKTVAAMDVLVPGVGEIMGGSQREERLNHLLKRMQEHGLNEAEYKWYTDLRRYGTVPHAGFGAGFERLVSYVTGLSNVRDVIAFPRTPGSIKF